jgi:hypothetical protein
MAKVRIIFDLITYVDFLSRGVTINAQYYSNSFLNDLHQGIRKKRLQIVNELKRGVLNCFGSPDNIFYVARITYIIYYIHSSSPLFVLHALPISSSLT